MLDETFMDYVEPSQNQKVHMQQTKYNIKLLVGYLEQVLPEGADKNHVMRLIRTAGMWANVCILKDENGKTR